MLQKKIAVTGIGAVVLPPVPGQKPLEDLIFETVNEALTDARIAIEDIDSVVMACSDLTDGRVISCMTTGGAAGVYYKDMTNISSSADHGFIAACMKILAGEADRCLVVSWGKASVAAFAQIDPLTLDYLYLRPLQLNRVTAAAIRATRYLAETQVDERLLARVVCRNKKNGLKTPYGQDCRPTEIEQVLSSPYVSWPLRKEFIVPESDGACALVLQSGESLRTTAVAPAWVVGLGWTADSYWSGGKSSRLSTSQGSAAQRAKQMSARFGREREIDVAEISAFSAYDELISYEELGFCARGGGAEFFEQVERGEHKPFISPSGGLFCFNPPFAANLFRIAEAAYQVTSRAGDHQVPKATNALAHCVSGLFRESCSVVMLSGDP